MSASNLPSCVASARRLLAAVSVFAFVPGAGQAAAPGITGTSFSLAASPAYVTQPDGALIYSWGYGCAAPPPTSDRKSTRLNSSHQIISYAVFCLKKKKTQQD